jgi:hypothetical protein
VFTCSVVINSAHQKQVHVELAGEIHRRDHFGALLVQTARVRLSLVFRAISECEVSLREEIVTLGERLVDLQIQLLVDLNRGLEGFK